MLCQFVMFCRCKLQGRKKSLQNNFPFPGNCKGKLFPFKGVGIDKIQQKQTQEHKTNNYKYRTSIQNH